MNKVPVWSTVGGAFAFVWHERKRFAALAFAPVLIASLVYVLFAWMLPMDAMAEISEGTRSMVPMFLATWGAGLISFLLWVTFSVAWHRRYLMPGEAVTVGQALMWRKRQTRFFLRFLGLSLLGVIIFLVIIIAAVAPVFFLGLAESGSAAMALFALAITPVSVVVLLVLSRWSIWLPAAAAEDSMSFRESWRATRGNAWRLVFITILIWIPFAVVGIVLQFLLEPAFFGFGMHVWSGGGNAGDMAKQMEFSWANRGLTMGFIANLIYMAYYYVSIAVGVTALSIAYRCLTGGGRGEHIDITA